jgi:hypothetical protein
MHFLMCRDRRCNVVTIALFTLFSSARLRDIIISTISFCEYQRSSQHRWSRSPRVFKKNKTIKMPTSTPPYTRKNSGMLLHPDCFYGPGDVGML